MISPTIEPHDLVLLHEDDDLIVVDKPPMLHSVRGQGASVADLLAVRFPTLLTSSPNQSDVGLVNRLDFETRGVLIAARSPKVWASLRDKWNHHQIEKIYRARVIGIPPPLTKVVGFIGAKSRRSAKVAFSRTQKPRYSYTESVVKKESVDVTGGTSVVSVSTRTGARHQVRAHLASIGCPLQYDNLYGAPPSDEHSFLLIAATVSWCHQGRTFLFRSRFEVPGQQAGSLPTHCDGTTVSR